MKTPYTTPIVLRAYVQAMRSRNTFSDVVLHHTLFWLENHRYKVTVFPTVRFSDSAIVVSIEGALKREHEHYFSGVVKGVTATKLVILPKLALSEDSILNDL